MLQRDRDDRQLFSQHGLSQSGHGIDDTAVDGGIGSAGEMDDDVRHEWLLIG
ncbi:hypothetical protein D3C71_2064360 [compost metagenome]